MFATSITAAPASARAPPPQMGTILTRKTFYISAPFVGNKDFDPLNLHERFAFGIVRGQTWSACDVMESFSRHIFFSQRTQLLCRQLLHASSNRSMRHDIVEGMGARLDGNRKTYGRPKCVPGAPLVPALSLCRFRRFSPAHRDRGQPSTDALCPRQSVARGVDQAC